MKVNPDAAGLDTRQLDRISEHLTRAYVEPGKIAGCQTLVARHGHVAYFDSLGQASIESGTPITDDTIFRIYSMTKPITSVALMLLYERSLFQLSDPVSRFIPQWKDLKVCEVAADRSTQLVEPERPMIVRDLLMHTSGLTYGGDPGHPVDRLYAKANLREESASLADMVDRLAEIPLKFHPGTRWHYSFSTDICGRLVEILSGQRFDDFLRTELFEPLGMVDTGFVVPDDKVDRFTSNYRRRQDKSLALVEDAETSAYRQPRAMLSGGGGLVSTSADYLRFCQMLLNGGELDGVRIMGRKTIEFMRANHIPGGHDLSTIALGNFGETGFSGVGFGLGFAMSLGPVETMTVGCPGDYYWGGAASTIFWIDPIEDLIVIFMTQFMPSGTFNFRGQLKQLVYPAIVD